MLANLSVVSLTFTDFFTGESVASPEAGRVVNVTGRFTASGFTAGLDFVMRRTTPGGDHDVPLGSDGAWNAGVTRDVALGRYVIPESASAITFTLDPDGDHAETSESDNAVTINLNAGNAAPSGLSAPVLNSLPGATYSLYLSFIGSASSDNFYDATSQVTPVFDRDSNPSSFSASELEWVNRIWRNVAEDFAPFNINVTTVPPAAGAKHLRANIGGNYLDWYIDEAGGVSGIDTFRLTGNPNIFIFTDGFFSAAHVADAVSHEAGHAFGLNHHSDWSGGVKVNEYAQGAGDWSPLMGGGYRTHTTWWNGPGNTSPTALQDDLTRLASPNNKFGYRADDVPGAPLTARDLGVVSAAPATFSGIIGRNDDVDLFRVTFGGGGGGGGGQFRAVVEGIGDGANFDAVLELRDAANQVIQTGNPSNSRNASITATLAPGVYYLAVRSNGEYGRIGQYTLSASLTGPHADVRDAQGTLVAAQAPIALPQTPTGGPAVYADFVLRNTGDQTLTLGAPVLSAGLLMSGSIPGALAAGAQATFSIALDPTSAGAIEGALSFTTNDPAQPTVVLNFTGVVGTPAAVVVNPDEDEIGGGLGSVFVLPVAEYQSALIPVTFTIRNDGDAPLVLSGPQVPLGFVIVGTPPSEAGPGQSILVSIARDTAVVGAFTGNITFTTNDPETHTIVLGVQGEVAPPKPDLNATITTVFPAATVGGKSGSAKVRVLNEGTERWTGLATITLYVIPGDEPGVGDTPVATLTKRLTIRVNKTSTQTVRFIYPVLPADATLNIVAVIAPAEGQVETDSGNNTAASATSVLVAKPFTRLTGAFKPIAKPVSLAKTFSRTISIANSGNVKFSGQVTAQVYLSTDGFFDEADALFGVVTKTMLISAGKAGSLTVKFALPWPITVSPGAYTLFIVIPADATTGAGAAVTFA